MYNVFKDKENIDGVPCDHRGCLNHITHPCEKCGRTGGKMQKENEDYLGDGVYVEFDGYGTWLKANHHEHPTDKVYLEPSVLHALNNFVKRMKDKND